MPIRDAVRTVDLVKVYGTGDTAVRALDGVSVGFERGRFTAIMGPSGSGKSTLMHCAAGLDPATSGTVHIGQTQLTGRSDRKLTRLRRTRIGFVFQSFNLLPALTAAQNIRLPLEVRELEQTVVMVTHDPVAASFADRVVLLADGRLAGDVADPRPEVLLDNLARLAG